MSFTAINGAASRRASVEQPIHLEEAQQTHRLVVDDAGEAQQMSNSPVLTHVTPAGNTATAQDAQATAALEPIETAKITALTQTKIESQQAPISPVSAKSEPEPAPEMPSAVLTRSKTSAASPSTPALSIISAGPPSPPQESPPEPHSPNAPKAKQAPESSASAATATSPVREFICRNDDYNECQTGQYTLDLSRKTISDHFGRNKSCTRLITEWPLVCRKHYQRATYHKKQWQMRKCFLIKDQFEVIDRLFPGTLYNVQLKKSEEKRLSEFAKALQFAKDDAARAEITKRFEAPPEDPADKLNKSPIAVLQKLHAHLGDRQTKVQVKATVDLLVQVINNGEAIQLPEVEFLPQIPAKPSSKGKGRVSEKGAVKKS